MNKHIEKHILFVGPSERGGIASVLDTYQTEFQPFHRISTHCSGSKIKKVIYSMQSYFRIIRELLCNKQISLVHIHTSSYNSFWRKSIVVQIAKWFEKKIVLHIHSGAFKEFYAKNAKKADKVLRKCDLIVCLSKEWKEFFNRIGYKNVEVVNNPILPPVIITNNTSDSKFHLLFLGLICQNKGIYDLVEALHSHHTVFAGKLMLHIGGNGEADKLCSLIEQHRLHDIITYEGWVDGNKKIELMNKANALILPSYYEGVPVCLLEAMSYSKPVITTLVGGIPSIVTNGINGIEIPIGNPNKIADAIIHLMNDSQLSARLGNQGKEISKNYLMPVVATHLREIYSQVLND